LARSGVDGAAAEGEDEDEEEDEDGEGEGTAKKAWVKAVFLDENKEEWTFQRTWVLLISNVPTRLSDRNKGFLLPVPQNTN